MSRWYYDSSSPNTLRLNLATAQRTWASEDWSSDLPTIGLAVVLKTKGTVCILTNISSFTEILFWKRSSWHQSSIDRKWRISIYAWPGHSSVSLAPCCAIYLCLTSYMYIRWHFFFFKKKRYLAGTNSKSQKMSSMIS